MPVVRALDVGFGNTKFVTATDGATSIECSHFPSLAYPSVGDQTHELMGGRRKTVAIPIGDLFYEVGPEVQLAADNFRPNNLNDRYTDTPEYLALMRGALHYMRVPAIDLLVVGLPVATFRTHKVALEKLATGVHDVGRGKTVEVRKALAVAQPQGALVHFAASSNKLDKLSKETSLVIDVGSRTFDWLVARGTRLVTRRSHSVNRGTFDVVQKIASEISLDIRSEYRDLDAVDTALRTGKPLTIFQAPYPLDKLKPIVQGVAHQAVQAMLQLVGDLHSLDNVILAGGGAHLFRKAIREALPQLKVKELSDAIYANVRGFQLAGQDAVRAAPSSSQVDECTS